MWITTIPYFRFRYDDDSFVEIDAIQERLEYIRDLKQNGRRVCSGVVLWEVQYKHHKETWNLPEIQKIWQKVREIFSL